ncbi:MAG: cyclic nucleotide-binding domain-containing protein [Halobacteriovoraceae bacterium]|jgi:CRP/FNR family transcriptional regulator, cyclic AMP receptor protein|nr:cyclic nucleotide-binding domain-containing protein [Halobacteriovoraceae bacterium]
MSILQVVKGSPLFYELYDQEIMEIVEKCRVLNLQPEDAIFKEGDTGDEIYLILNGSAEVRKGEISLAKLRKGDLFGEMVLLKENTRKADIVCSNFCDVLVMKYGDLFGLYETNQKVFSLIMLNLARLMATRLNKAGESIRVLATENHELKGGKKAA